MTTQQPRTPSSPGKGRSRLATLVPVAILVLGLAEIAILVAIGVNSSLWWSVLIIAIGWVVGIALLVAAGQQSFVRLRSLVQAVRGRGDVQDHLSRPAFTLLAALLFFFPGLLTDVLAIVLLLTPVQRRAVRAAGLGSGSEAAQRVLYRRTRDGVLQGEIVITPEDSASSRKDRPGGPDGGSAPPVITQG
ncbi:FxsA family protein [Brachybacterium hainanense]|uniref:FxsA family protein n=1 Tax=Brachybacterium hainanense TaxID=1541174 RepID=A0ABV6RBD9_9MICO